MTMFEQLPPHDIQAEESVIAAVMVDSEAMNKVATILEARDFFREANGWIFETCRALWERGESINQVTVAHELDRRKRLEDVGGLSFLSDLVLNLPTPVGAEHFAAIVKRDAMYRRLLSAATNIVELAYQGAPDFMGSLARAEMLLSGLREQVKSDAGFRHLREFLAAYGGPETAEEQERAPVALYAIRTGLRELDAVLGGLKPGQLVVVGAETGMGKTGLVNGFARNAAVTQNASVAMFSMEMTGEQLAMRMLASEARINSKVVQRRNLLTEEQWTRLFHALAMLDYADIHIDASGGVSPGQIGNKCRKLAKERGLDLLIVDHLQIMEADKPSGNTVADLTATTRTLKSLALNFNIPVILCSQLNRQNNGALPTLRDLRGSGSIEQDADVVLFLFRPEKHVRREEWEKAHTADQPYPAGVAELLVAKQRDGDDNVLLRVRYRAPFTRFEDFDLPAVAPVQGAIPDFMLATSGYH